MDTRPFLFVIIIGFFALWLPQVPFAATEKSFTVTPDKENIGETVRKDLRKETSEEIYLIDKGKFPEKHKHKRHQRKNYVDPQYGVSP